MRSRLFKVLFLNSLASPSYNSFMDTFAQIKQAFENELRDMPKETLAAQQVWKTHVEVEKQQTLLNLRRRSSMDTAAMNAALAAVNRGRSPTGEAIAEESQA